MTKTPSPRLLDHVGDLDKATGRVLISKSARTFIDAIWKRTGGDTDAIAAAAAGGDVKTVGLGSSFAFRSDPATGVFDSALTVVDMPSSFQTEGVEVAFRSFRATLDTGLGIVHIDPLATSGATTTFSIQGNDTDSVRVDVNYAVAGSVFAVAVVTVSAIDSSTAGGTPASGIAK